MYDSKGNLSYYFIIPPSSGLRGEAGGGERQRQPQPQPQPQPQQQRVIPSVAFSASGTTQQQQQQQQELQPLATGVIYHQPPVQPFNSGGWRWVWFYHPSHTV